MVPPLVDGDHVTDLGAPVEFTGTIFLRLVDGRIDEYWINSDVHVMLAQLKVGA